LPRDPFAENEKIRAWLSGDLFAKVLFLGDARHVRVTIPAGATVKQAREIIGKLGRPVKALISRRGPMSDPEPFAPDIAAFDERQVFFADVGGSQELSIEPH
jgi:hypothetical protein